MNEIKITVGDVLVNDMIDFNATDKIILPDMVTIRGMNLPEGTVAAVTMGQYHPPETHPGVTPPTFDDPSLIGTCRVVKDNSITITMLNLEQLKFYGHTKESLYSALNSGELVLSPTTITKGGKTILKTLAVSIVPVMSSAHYVYFAKYYNLPISEEEKMEDDSLLTVFCNSVRGVTKAGEQGKHDLFYYFVKEIRTPYNQDTRHYHTIQHIGQMMEVMLGHHAFKATPELLLAILFHDRIYDADNNTGNTNERASADRFKVFAERVGINSASITKVVELIMSTEHSSTFTDVYKYQSVCTKDEINLIRDIDFSAFAGPYGSVIQNGADVITEMINNGTDKESIISGRLGFLKLLLEKGLFVSDSFKEKMESKAMENIAKEVEGLEKLGFDLYYPKKQETLG